MKRTLLLLLICLHLNNAFGQESVFEKAALTGEMELIFDLSKMKNTKGGQFLVTGGGKQTTHKIEGDILIVKRLLDQPLEVYVSYYPAKTINENPGRPLNSIAAKVRDRNIFLGVPGTFNIIVNDTISNIEIVNESPYQKKFTELAQLKLSIINEAGKEIQLEVADELKKAGMDETLLTVEQSVIDSIGEIFLRRRFELYEEKYKYQVFNFLKNNPLEPATLLELFDNSTNVGEASGSLHMEQLIYLYNNLSDELKALPVAQSVHGSVFGGRLIGKQAPVFTLEDPSGNLVSLEYFKGKVTLLEFWASWCGPCRVKNPELLKIYEKYQNKGFEILGVSLDSKKEGWLKAIEKDGLTWTQVSSLNGFKSIAAELYMIAGIPANFLIDKNGKIIEYQLGEKQLDEFLKKMLD